MAEPGDVWWEIDILARNLLKVSLPSDVLRMPPDQARRFAQALNMAADATGTDDHREALEPVEGEGPAA